MLRLHMALCMSAMVYNGAVSVSCDCDAYGLLVQRLFYCHLIKLVAGLVLALQCFDA